MALQVGDILLVQCVGQLHDQTIINTAHYVVGVASSTGSTNDQVYHLANVLGNGLGGNKFKENLLKAACPQYILEKVTAQRIYPTRTYAAEYPVGEPGLLELECTLSNIAVSISRRSDSATRDGQGRWQFAGVPASKYDSGMVQLGYRTGELATFANELMLPVQGTLYAVNWRPCLYTPKNLPDRYRVISSVIVQDTVRTMHRRTVRVGI